MVTGFVDFSKQTRHQANASEFWKKWEFSRLSAGERHGVFPWRFLEFSTIERSIWKMCGVEDARFYMYKIER